MKRTSSEVNKNQGTSHGEVGKFKRTWLVKSESCTIEDCESEKKEEIFSTKKG
jgi:hypothetical protein